MIRYYLIIIIAGSATIGCTSYIFAGEETGESIATFMLLSFLSTAIAFGIDAVCAILVRRLAKGKAIDPEAKYYKVSKRELRIYKRLRIKAWKDRIPEMGGLLVKFQKKRIEEKSSEYLEAFLKETCYAELMHQISVFAGFLTILALPMEYCFVITLPTAIVNAFLNTLPVMVQRYVRPHLLSAYRRSVRLTDKKS